MQMNILVLGGTVFLGRHLVEALVARGHAVTTFNRGTRAGAAAVARRLTGDRDGGLQALAEATAQAARASPQRRPWDAVIDTCGYVPRVVRQSCELLAPHASRYVFVSSISAYADLARPHADESAPLAAAPDPAAADAEDVAAHYGGLKAACERVVAEHFAPESTLLVRPGLIVGPHDPTGRFTYWARRFAQGGRVLLPGPAHRPVQLIDVRDLAGWMVAAVESGRGGAFNLTGPVGGCSFADFAQAGQQANAVPARPCWVSDAFLRDEGVQPWTELPLWLGEHMPGMLQVDIGRAQASGLHTRPLSRTFADTRDWAASGAAAEGGGRPGVGLAPEREAALLARWDALAAAQDPPPPSAR